MGVNNSNIDQAINRQQGCMLTSLIYNYVAYIITTKTRARKPLVARVIIKEVTSCLKSITVHSLGGSGHIGNSFQKLENLGARSYACYESSGIFNISPFY